MFCRSIKLNELTEQASILPSCCFADFRHLSSYYYINKYSIVLLEEFHGMIQNLWLMLLLVEPFFIYDADFVLEFYNLASTFGQCMAMGPYFTWILGMVFWNEYLLLKFLDLISICFLENFVWL